MYGTQKKDHLLRIVLFNNVFNGFDYIRQFILNMRIFSCDLNDVKAW